jgi:hypothetical protein
MAPDLFAEKALRRIARKKPVIIIPLEYRIYWWFYRLSPSRGISISNKIYKIIIKNIGNSA